MLQHRFPIVIGMAMVLTLGSGLLQPVNADQRPPGRHHKTQNGKGCTVEHKHLGQCDTWQCGSLCTTDKPDAACEATLKIRSADRKHPWTSAWNCHGRTFDNRMSWTGDASLFISCDSGVCPASPKIGDAIVWANPKNPGAKFGDHHSVTIKGAWNGTKTKVSSKYGCCGEYEHELSNSTWWYGPKWSVVRLSSSPVFFSSPGFPDGESEDARLFPNPGVPLFPAPGGPMPYPGAPLPAYPDLPLPADPAELEEVARSMPWYPTVIASAVGYAVVHPRRVRENGKIGEEALDLLWQAQDPITRLEILAEDLRDPEHYSVLAVYNDPADALEFVEGIEAGRVLVQMAQEFPDDVREAVVELLEETALGIQFTDAARAASIFFASQILEPWERADLEQRVSSSIIDQVGIEEQENLVDYYRSEFLLPDSE